MSNEALLELEDRVIDLESANNFTVLSGHGAPASVTGVTGNLYINDDTGNLYRKTDAVTWVLLVNILGPQGLPGVASAAFQATHAYVAGTVVQHADGTWLVCTSSHTSGATIDLTKFQPISAHAGSVEQVALAATYARLSGVQATATADGAVVAGKHNPVDATTGNRAMTLADATDAGQMVVVSKKDATANTVTLSVTHLRDGGAGAIVLVGQYEAITLTSKADGSWWPVGDHKTKAYFDSAYVADPAVSLLGKAVRWYGDSWAAGYGLSAGQSYIQLAATQLGATTFQNLAVSGSALQSVAGLMIWHGSGYEWTPGAADLVAINAGINDARYNDLSLLANRKWLKALKHSLRISCAIALGAARVPFTMVTTTNPGGYWTFGGAGWFNGPYPYGTDGTNVAATQTTGNTAQFTFEGDEITVLCGGYYTDTTCVVDFLIDGEPVRTVRFENDQVLYPSSATTVGLTAQRFAGLAPGPHTVQMTKVDTTSAAFYIDSAFTRSTTPPLVLVVKEPTLPTADYALFSPYNNGNDASIKAMQKVVDDVASEFTGVRLCNLPVLTPVTDFQADGIHPNAATGVPKLQAAALAALGQPGLLNRVEDIAESPRIRRQLTPRSSVVSRFRGVTLASYTIPAGAVALRIRALGSGASGGSGRRGAGGTVRCGGGAGSGGGYDEILLSTYGLPPTLYVTAGGSVAGGAAVTTDDTNGNDGNNGVASYVVTDNTLPADESIYLSYAPGGAKGKGGTNATGTGGASIASRMGLTGNGGSASATGGVGVSTATNGYGGVGQGGGSGGGITSANAAGAGGSGWWSGLFLTSTIAVPAGGANTGGVGGAGTATTMQGRFAAGPSGAGGGANLSGPAGAGGAGGRGSGGGGGGASVDGNASGAGGPGGEGFVEITAIF